MASVTGCGDFTLRASYGHDAPRKHKTSLIPRKRKQWRDKQGESDVINLADYVANRERHEKACVITLGNFRELREKPTKQALQSLADKFNQ